MSDLKLVKGLRVGICIPAGDEVKTWFSYDLARMVGYTAANRPDIELRQYIATGSLLPQLRELLAVEALKNECTHILWLDSDMQYPRDTIVRLLAHNVPAVCANYTARQQPFLPHARRELTNDPKVRVFTLDNSTGLEKVAGCGMGVMLVSATALRKITPPRFMIGWVPDDNAHVGEDMYHCRRLKETGTQLYVDHDLSKEVSHVGAFAYAAGHALVYARDQGLLEPEYVPDAGNAALQGADVPADPMTDGA